MHVDQQLEGLPCVTLVPKDGPSQTATLCTFALITNVLGLSRRPLQSIKV